ncbi:MAG TPA: cell wall hydrolase [Candidatus Paceibacterota bacterium]|nr:cell wall hydrolase [Candidatus Paceibacterota bacterium]
MRHIYGVLALILLAFCAVGEVQASTASDEEAFFRSQIIPMALNVYHEARGENELGQMMVAYVTLMRAEDNRSMWGGHTILGVVFKKKQFSWTDDPKIAKSLPHGPAWDKALAVATWVAMGFFEPPDVLVEARYYLNPATADHQNLCLMATRLIQVGIVGNHRFYREASPGEKPRFVPIPFHCT